MASALCFVHNAFHVLSSVGQRLKFAKGTRDLQVRRYRWLKASAGQQISEPSNILVNSSRERSNTRLIRKGDKLNLKFTELAYGGASVAYIPADDQYLEEDVGMPVYGPKGACPGESIECVISKVRRRDSTKTDTPGGKKKSIFTRSYAEAYFVKQLHPSPHAVDVPCSHFGNSWLGPPAGGCGGCSSLNVPYPMQLAEKERHVQNLFTKLSAGDHTVEPIIGCKNTLHYRNKMEFTFGRRWYPKNNNTVSTDIIKTPGDYEYTLGLHAPQRFDKIIQIDECFLHHPIGNEIIQFIRQRSPELLLEPYDTRMNQGYLRNVAIRTAHNLNGELEVMVNIITSPCDVPQRLKPLANEIAKKFPSVVCVVQSIRGVKSQHMIEHGSERLLEGNRNYIEQQLCGQVFRISPNSFFQTNPEQAEVVYNEVLAAARLTGTETVLDLFCGTGTIGISLAHQAKHVLGIDSIQSAIADARINAAANGVSNVTFHQGNLEKLKQLQQESPLPEPDVIIVDPPRAGLHKDLVKYIAASDAKRIVYVSCNPMSQVEDIQRLQELAKDKFRVARIQVVDMFPNTYHIETICSLQRNSEPP